MKPPENMVRIVNRRRYSTKTATLIAHDAYWDGHNFERHGRNTFLYRTPRGAYFVVNLTQWQGEQDTLAPLTHDDAYQLYEDLSEHEVNTAAAFPDVAIEDA